MFDHSSESMDLPSVPAALARVIQLTNEPNVTADQISGAIMLDQALATKVLRLANSAYIGRRNKVSTITEAVVTLGFTSVRNLAASASVIDALFPKQLFLGFSWSDMWVHSVTCGLAAEQLYSRIAGRMRGSNESAFICGLLHDVGKLVLARALPQKFMQVVEACREYNYEMLRAETNILGTNHAKVGGELAEQWGFPEKLEAGIACHHMPDAAEEHEDLARAVYAADLLAKRLSRNYLMGVPVQISLKDVADAAELPITDIDYAVNQVRDGLKQCGEILSWASAMPDANDTKTRAA